MADEQLPAQPPVELKAGWIDMDDGTKLYLRRWIPGLPSGPRCAVQVVHGMAEHGLRYDRLARRLCGAGIEVWAADQRGHGLTADLKVNDPGRGGLRGHTGDEDGFNRVTADIEALNRRIAGERPGIPLMLLGHSWGSFIAQNYIETFDAGSGGLRLAGCILSGTKGPGDPKLKPGAPLLGLLAGLLGCRKISRLAWSMADGSFSKPFRPNRTSFDWLSRDEAEVDAFIRDPLCGNLCSVGFYRDMVNALLRIHKPENLRKIRRDLPVYLFSGSADPVGNMGEGPVALIAAYRKLEIRDLELAIYPDARHETLNETNREEVTLNLLAWIEKHL